MQAHQFQPLVVSNGSADDLLDRLAQGTAEDADAVDQDTLNLLSVGHHVPAAVVLVRDPMRLALLAHNTAELTLAFAERVRALQQQVTDLQRRLDGDPHGGPASFEQVRESVSYLRSA